MVSDDLVKDDRVGEGFAQPPRVAHDRSVTAMPDRRRGHAQIQIVELVADLDALTSYNTG